MVTYKHSFDGGMVTLTFSGKPDGSIRSLLKGAGFRWNPGAGVWWRRGVSGAADFLAALDKRMNPGKPDGQCWACHSPNGFFRRYGPGTPVYCDACDKVNRAVEGKKQGSCPICGVFVHVKGMTTDGRIIGTCGDAFTPDQWTTDGPCGVCGCPGTERTDRAVRCGECEKVTLQVRAENAGNPSRTHDDPTGVDTLYEDSCRDACGL